MNIPARRLARNIVLLLHFLSFHFVIFIPHASFSREINDGIYIEDYLISKFFGISARVDELSLKEDIASAIKVGQPAHVYNDFVVKSILSKYGSGRDIDQFKISAECKIMHHRETLCRVIITRCSSCFSLFIGRIVVFFDSFYDLGTLSGVNVRVSYGFL
ncbi:hypothetical protein [Magnetospirillum aberrantis]|uniref:Uncharacterized protein n=1 Tax=Magnetospirillum aberrantis SpK TaxID=908842 RepID=A0A7C9UX38_9PROT|nr:hypothetical protein [Magnetospirillum aberrantis]NFV78773.1 hypothetical protein [Magnetospirillum aberrantis SpK]